MHPMSLSLISTRRRLILPHGSLYRRGRPERAGRLPLWLPSLALRFVFARYFVRRLNTRSLAGHQNLQSLSVDAFNQEGMGQVPGKPA